MRGSSSTTGLINADGTARSGVGIGGDHANSPSQYKGLLDMIESGVLDDVGVGRAGRASGGGGDGGDGGGDINDVRRMFEDEMGLGRTGSSRSRLPSSSAQRRAVHHIEDLVTTTPKSWFERRWTRSWPARGVRRVLSVLNEVHFTPQLRFGAKTKRWAERVRFMTTVHAGAAFQLELDMPEKPLFSLPKKADIVACIRSKKPAFEFKYDFNKDSLHVKTVNKLSVGDRGLDMDRLRTSARDGAATMPPPMIMNSSRVIRHLWVLVNYESSKTKAADMSVDVHVPLWQDDMLQLKYDLTDFHNVDLSRLNVRSSLQLANRTILGDSLWLIPSYDFGAQATSCALHQDFHDYKGHARCDYSYKTHEAQFTLRDNVSQFEAKLRLKLDKKDVNDPSFISFSKNFGVAIKPYKARRWVDEAGYGRE